MRTWRLGWPKTRLAPGRTLTKSELWKRTIAFVEKALPPTTDVMVRDKVALKVFASMEFLAMDAGAQAPATDPDAALRWICSTCKTPNLPDEQTCSGCGSHKAASVNS
jgi:hypothetical protein